MDSVYTCMVASTPQRRSCGVSEGRERAEQRGVQTPRPCELNPLRVRKLILRDRCTVRPTCDARRAGGVLVGRARRGSGRGGGRAGAVPLSKASIGTAFGPLTAPRPVNPGLHGPSSPYLALTGLTRPALLKLSTNTFAFPSRRYILYCTTHTDRLVRLAARVVQRDACRWSRIGSTDGAKTKCRSLAMHK